MNQQPDISVVMTTYNQSKDSMAFTLKSIVAQDYPNFELVIVDDRSTEDPSEFIRSFLGSLGFDRYEVSVSAHNEGTVRNLARGLRIAKGQFVKQISPGDGLYSSTALSNIAAFCASHAVKVGFGELVSYTLADNDTFFQSYNAPLNPEQYSEHQNLESIQKDLLVHANWIPGCALFYDRVFFLAYLEILSSKYAVTYCEDLACPLIALDNEMIRYFPHPILWYEMGTGVSTTGGIASRKRMYGDHRRFFDTLKHLHPNHHVVSRAWSLFRLREFVALRTPVYPIAQTLVKRRYAKNRLDDADLNLSFFSKCADSPR